MERIDKDGPGGCWLWTGPRDRKGYGIAWLPGRKSARAHRWVYEQLVGPIPEGLQIDHLCRVKACVNPDHLEPVTGRVNILRAYDFDGSTDPETCFRGHRYEPGSYYEGRYGSRECKQCSSKRHAEMYARRHTCN